MSIPTHDPVQGRSGREAVVGAKGKGQLLQELATTCRDRASGSSPTRLQFHPRGPRRPSGCPVASGHDRTRNPHVTRATTCLTTGLATGCGLPDRASTVRSDSKARRSRRSIPGLGHPLGSTLRPPDPAGARVPISRRARDPRSSPGRSARDPRGWRSRRRPCPAWPHGHTHPGVEIRGEQLLELEQARPVAACDCGGVGRGRLFAAHRRPRARGPAPRPRAPTAPRPRPGGPAPPGRARSGVPSNARAWPAVSWPSATSFWTDGRQLEQPEGVGDRGAALADPPGDTCSWVRPKSSISCW